MNEARKRARRLQRATFAALIALCGGMGSATAAPDQGSSQVMCRSIAGHNPQPANAHTMDSSDYPLLSWMQGEQGNVLLDVLVNPDGSVGDARVARSSGFVRLDGASTDIAKQRWRYVPVMSGGHPIACHGEVLVSWRLQTDPQQIASNGPFAVVRMKAADFPQSSLAHHEQGTSILMLLVDTDGKILKSMVAQSSGYADLDVAAIDAATHHKWAITPAQVNGGPIKTLVGLVVIWSPDNN